MSGTAARYLERPGRHAAVAAVWSFAAGDASSSIVAADGCFDLIVRVEPTGQPSAFVYTPVTLAHAVSIGAGTRLAGVRLRPGYGALAANDPEVLRAVERHVNDERSSDELESLVVAAIGERRGPPDILMDFLEAARRRAGRVRLSAVSRGACQRELQRACQRWLGITAKAFLRIERVRAARGAIRAGLPLAVVAADFGYADQAHLTRDVRQLLGVTPRQLRPVGILQDSPRAKR